MARMRLSKAQLSKDITTPSSPTRAAYDAFPPSPRSKSPSKRNARPVLYGAHGAILSQRNLPTPVGQFGFLERPHVDLNRPSTLPQTENIPSTLLQDSFTEVPRTPHGRKRLAQQLRWENEILPILLRPYMEYLQRSLNLSQDIELEHDNTCVCPNPRDRVIDVVVLRFNSESLSFLFDVVDTHDICRIAKT
jgi:hypothetical protein